MALLDGVECLRRELPARKIMVQETGNLGGHVPAVGDTDEILIGTEEPFQVRPWGADQGNSAGESFEHANGGNPTQAVGIAAPRNVEGESRTGINAGR